MDAATRSGHAAPVHGTVAAALEAAARADAPYLTFHAGGAPRPVDARAALALARRFAAALRAHGVRRGDRVAIALPGTPDFVQGLLGAMLAGAVPVPLATPLTFGSVDRFTDRVAAVVAHAGVRHALVTERLRDGLRDRGDVTLDVCWTPADLRALRADTAPAPSLGPGDLALLQYTSGTTDRPKGVAISHGALAANAHAIATGLRLGPSDVGVSWLPPHHDMGLVGALLTTVFHPYPVHVLRTEAFLMRPGAWPALVAEVGATVSAAPNFGYELCAKKARLDDADLGAWRAALSGAEPVRPATVRRFEERFAAHGFRGTATTPVYGLAEATLAVTFSDPDAPLRARDVDGRSIVSVGRPVAGTEVRVRGGRASGEIEVRGPSLMQGYFRDDRASADALVDGWLRTGDLGALVDGELFVTGRSRDLVIKAGRNIHPEDVEAVVAELPCASGGVAAFARDNATTGSDDLVVRVETRLRDEAARAAAAAAIRGEVLAALDVKIDDVAFVPVGSLPRTTSGKIRRSACAQVPS